MKKIAILGASYLQKPLVEKARLLGIETHVFAWDNDRAVCKGIADFFYPISVLEKEQILTKCREINIDGITTIATDVCIPAVAYVANNLKFVSNSYQSAVISTNKIKMRKAFKEYNVNSPKSYSIKNVFELNDLDIDFPVIVKPSDRSGSKGVSKVYSSFELENAVKIALMDSFEKKTIVEEYINGIEVSVESISWKGKHYILAITDKIKTKEPYFVELEHHQPSSIKRELKDIIKNETIKALNALNIRFGASHSEFKITKSGEVFLIEVGARMGGDFIGSHLVRLSTGYDYLKGVIDIALGTFSEPVLQSQRHISSVYFLAKDSQKKFMQLYTNEKGIVEKEIFSKKLTMAKESNDRSGYLICINDID